MRIATNVFDQAITRTPTYPRGETPLNKNPVRHPGAARNAPSRPVLVPEARSASTAWTTRRAWRVCSLLPSPRTCGGSRRYSLVHHPLGLCASR